MSEPNSADPARFYESYLVRYFFGPWAQDLLERARPQAGECVLDLACGTGALTREVLRHIGPHGSVIGVDISPDMLRVASEVVGSHGGVAEWRQGSAEALPLPDASIDLAVCQQGLQFFPDKLEALCQLKRVLKPGGRMALSVWRGIEHWPVQHALSLAAHGRLGRAITHLRIWRARRARASTNGDRLPACASGRCGEDRDVSLRRRIRWRHG